MPGTAEVKLLLDPESLFSKWKAEKLNMHMSQKRGMADMINRVCQAHWLLPETAFSGCVHTADRNSRNLVDHCFLRSSRGATGCWGIFISRRLGCFLKCNQSRVTWLVVMVISEAILGFKLLGSLKTRW